jgi:hypothetical protein
MLKAHPVNRWMINVTTRRVKSGLCSLYETSDCRVRTSPGVSTWHTTGCRMVRLNNSIGTSVTNSEDRTEAVRPNVTRRNMFCIVFRTNANTSIILPRRIEVSCECMLKRMWHMSPVYYNRQDLRQRIQPSQTLQHCNMHPWATDFKRWCKLIRPSSPSKKIQVNFWLPNLSWWQDPHGENDQQQKASRSAPRQLHGCRMFVARLKLRRLTQYCKRKPVDRPGK